MNRRPRRQFLPLTVTNPPIKLLDHSFKKLTLKKKETNTTRQESQIGGSKIIKALTIGLLGSYKNWNKDFNYHPRMNPRRVITQNSKPRRNQGYDNSDHELILRVNDTIGDEKKKYTVLDGLGSGSFGQAIKCRSLSENGKLVAIKVIKNQKTFTNQALLEIQILATLMKYKKGAKIVDYLHHFVYRNHLCIVFELLSVNLLQLIKLNHYRGFSIRILRRIATQVLNVLVMLYDTGIIHCDLKPENILLESPNKTNIKVIDFGSSCFVHQAFYSYLQSRFYRSPEVLLQMRYSQAIDMWSFGCIIAELYLGLPLFPGVSEFDQLSRIVKMFGNISNKMLKQSRATKRFYNITDEEFILKTTEQYSIENQTRASEHRNYFNYETFPEIIMNVSIKKKLKREEIEKELKNRACLLDFLNGCLRINPTSRWTPKEAIQHPFITGEEFKENFIPIPSRKRKYYILPKELLLKQQYISSTPIKKNNPKLVGNKNFQTKQRSNRNNYPLYGSQTQPENSYSSQTSETSETSEIEVFPNNTNKRFNSQSFIKKRSPNQNFETSSGSESSELEFFNNIRRAKRSLGWGVVTNKNKDLNFSSNKKIKRRNKLKSWSDGREDIFSDRGKEGIEIINDPQQLNFAQKLTLKPVLKKKSLKSSKLSKKKKDEKPPFKFFNPKKKGTKIKKEMKIEIEKEKEKDKEKEKEKENGNEIEIENKSKIFFEKKMKKKSRKHSTKKKRFLIRRKRFRKKKN
ncbi:homeodomain interacting protein kinase isoform a [Anaeramoeba flamelloides]|uniref:Homeodomain interacting protein kinase isoform a n=1 Tax=Anaeramoeba flamelloides TaxID=1746091 RepID=A0AAV7YTK0_9EUKA|nr:homeodomain interacting protein kinase isoform a [Anaeramoeba flamelloides]